jgi:hypothetical protein
MIEIPRMTKEEKNLLDSYEKETPGKVSQPVLAIQDIQ